jgi:glyoxylase-like metal-dependent hydrolase (beta-lactamase superfamily II)
MPGTTQTADDSPPKTDEAVREAIGALGVSPFSFSIEAEGGRFEPLQGQRPGVPLHPSDFDSVSLHDPANDRMRLSWKRSILEPLTATVVYDEIVAGNGGYITGADIALHSSAARPMAPDRVAAVRRQQYLINPHLLIWDALRRESRGEAAIRLVGKEEIDGTQHNILEISAFPRAVRLCMPVDSCHVSRLITQENDFPCGDVEIAVSFSDWRNVGECKFPYKVELSRDGVVIRSETRKHIEIHPQQAGDTFVLPEALPFDATIAEQGVMNEQWIHRAIGMGAPISLHAEEVETVAISPDVISLGGGIHHSIAIALDGGVVVVDPPQHEKRSLEVIDAVKTAWPDKPITHLVLTHHHYDHSGGIRTYAAIGSELVVAEGDRDFIVDCLERPHTISPDKLAANPRMPKIHTVGDEGFSLGGGAVQIRRISSPHSAEDLVTYVASQKLLFNADLFNPGMIPPGVPPPPFWVKISTDFRGKIEALGLDIELLVGGHGVPEGRPYQDLVDFTKTDKG